MVKKKKGNRFLKKMKKKLTIAVGIALTAFGVLIFKLVYINVKSGKEYEQKVLTQQKYTSTVIPYRRGEILDCNGAVLATSQKFYNLILEPKNILERQNTREATVNALKSYFGFTDEEINGFLSNPESYYEIAKKKLTYDDIKPFQDFLKSDESSGVVGVYFEEEYKRVYPNNQLACHLIGFTVSGNVGMYGIEQEYNSILNGYNGREYNYLNNDYGMTNSIEPAINGYNLVTSIDSKIQSIVQTKVDAYMAETGAKNVSVLVMNPKDCSILALYNSHQFDLNDAYDLDATRYQFETDEEFELFKNTATDEEKVNALNKLWRNFVVSDVYEPGSTYKVFTIAGALEEGVINGNDTFVCDGGESKDVFFIRCTAYSRGGHGELNISQALEKSCNDALMQIASKEGPGIFDKYQVLFGFGQSTNIDIPGEPDDLSYSTVVYHQDTLNEVELATSAFGQGVCVSMIQICTAFSSVINGGYYYEPSVVSRIEDENGNIIDNLEPVLVRRTVSEETSAIMRQELFQVVEQGTGKRASVEGYAIGGKTGTAEKLPRGNGKYLISFIGFAPVDDPQVVIYVIVDEPNLADQSSSPEASYLFADIAEELFPYMNIYKTNDNYDLDLENAEDEGISPIFEGESPDPAVAGGNENPYASGETGQGGTTPETTTESPTTEQPAQ